MDNVLCFSQDTTVHCRGMPEVSHLYLHHNLASYVLVRWTAQRKAFGKPLNSQAVIRNKLAAMIARAESVQSWLENITYQMTHMVGLPYP